MRWKRIDYANKTERGDWVGEIVDRATGEKVYHGPYSFHSVNQRKHADLIAAAPDLQCAANRAYSFMGNWLLRAATHSDPEMRAQMQITYNLLQEVLLEARGDQVEEAHP